MKLSIGTATLLAVGAGVGLATQGLALSPTFSQTMTRPQTFHTPRRFDIQPTNTEELPSALPLTTDFDENESIQFPPPLGRAGRMKRAAEFWLNAAPIVASYYGLMGKVKLQELHGMTMTEREIEVRNWSSP